MRRFALRLAPVLHLTRVSSAIAAVGNVWLVLLWTRARPDAEPTAKALRDLALWPMLAAGAAVGLGLYVFGSGLNDVLDARRDRALRRGRPISSGHMPREAALTISVGSLLLAIFGATVFGSQAVVWTLGVAAAILLFNGVGKFVPGVGLVLISLIYAAHMLVVNPAQRFVWPVILVMLHATAAAALSHHLAGRTPKISVRAWIAAGLGLAVWCWGLLAHAAGRLDWWHADAARPLWPADLSLWILVAPGMLLIAFLFFGLWRLRRIGLGPRSADKLARYGSLWLTLYATAWLAGAGLMPEAAILGWLAAFGIVGTFLLRDLYAILEHPLGYRRE
jgi:4-hydroxybenzoate polyprenyltransferase